MLRKISSIDFKSSNTTSGKTVLIRVDYNVPVENERVLDDYRILKSIPTIKYCLEKGSKVVLMSGDAVKAYASAASSVDIITSVVDTISA